LRIGIDARSLSEITSGPSRVTYLLIKEFLKYDKVNKYIIFLNGPYLENFSLNQLNVIVKYKRNNFVHDYLFSKYINNFKLDIYFSTHNWSLIFKVPKVITITILNDLFHITDKNHFQKYGLLKLPVKWYFKLYTYMTIKNSDLIVTISNYSKYQINSRYKNIIKKIKVCYLAAGISQKEVNQQSYSELYPSKYFLYVGNFRSYKNLDILIHGYRQWLKNNLNLNYQLLLVSNDNNKRIKELVKFLGISQSVTFLKNINDEQLIELYANAKIFIFPSKQEGFGIPVLEAAMSKTPVIISDATTLVEITNGTAAVFKKNNYMELSDCISMVLKKENYNKFVKLGFQNAKKYSWTKSAKELIETFNSMYLKYIREKS